MDPREIMSATKDQTGHILVRGYSALSDDQAVAFVAGVQAMHAALT